MKPDLHNYEEYALDYIEGNLSAADELAFERFLEQHPEIAGEIGELVPVYAEPDMNVRFPDKEKLKKDEPRVVPLFPFSLNSWTVGVAATLALAAFAFSWMYTGGDANKSEGIVAEKLVSPRLDQNEDLKELDDKIKPVKGDGITDELANNGTASEAYIHPKKEAGREADRRPAINTVDETSPLATNDVRKGNGAEAGSPVEPLPAIADNQIAFEEPVPESGLAGVEAHPRQLVRELGELEIVPVETEFSIQSSGIAYAEIETVEIEAPEEENGGLNINLPFGLSGRVEADINAMPNSIGKIKKQKLKEALVPSFLSAR